MFATLSQTDLGWHISCLTCAVDCGIIINPDNVRAQIEGGIIFGLNAAIGHAIHIENGRVKESNFDDYPIMSMAEIPDIEIDIATNNYTPGGVGEIAVPPVAPAIANALFSATEERPRVIPFKLT